MTTAPPARAWPGECLFCGEAKQQVRHVEHKGHPKVQACYECRPGDAPLPVKKFAVLVASRFAYLIEAVSTEQAETFLWDELYAIDEDRDLAEWQQAGDRVWLAAWRRGEVTVIRDRRLPEGIE